MSVTLERTQTSEVNSNQIDYWRALDVARDKFLDYQVDEAFFEALENGLGDLSPADIPSSIEYWQLLSDYADYQMTKDPEVDSCTGAVMKVMFSTPKFFLAQSYIDQANESHQRPDRSDVNTTIEMVEAISRLATLVPNVTVGDVADMMTETGTEALAPMQGAQASQEELTTARHMVNWLRDKAEAEVKGVRHEVGFAQLLDHTGFEYREGTVAEDARGGDFMVTLNGREVPVDVKSSYGAILRRTDNWDRDLPYVTNGRNITMWTVLREGDFVGDTFRVNPGILQDRAGKLCEFLIQAEKERTRTAKRLRKR